MVNVSPRAQVGALLPLLVVLDAAIAFSQVVTGAISGRVTDTTGAVVPGATVQIQNVGTGFSRTAQTDSEGRYLSRNLPLGSYSVTVQQAGFRTEVRRGIVLTVASEVVVNVELAVGTVQEQVEVTAEAPAIETTTATLSGLVSQEQLRELPLNGRSIDSLAVLSPGVFVNRAHVKNAPIGQGLRISINGARPTENLFLYDGTTVNDTTTTGLGSAAQATLGVEGLLEFRLLTHNFSAEYGRNSGGVFSAVTRSGTNEFHGSVYEFVRNNIFDARNFFNPGELPPFRRNQFGAALGGPLIRDRIFFFANYEGLRRRQGETVISTVPDVNARRGLIPDPATGQLRQVTVNPAALPYVNLYPLPNGRNFGDGTAEAIADFSDRATEDYAMERMDFRLSDKDNFYWRYIYDPADSATPRAVPITTESALSTNHFVVLSETHIFSGTSLNEFRFAFNRTERGRDSLPITNIDPSLSFVPGQPLGLIRFEGGGQLTTQLSELGTDQGSPLALTQNLFQVTDTFSTVRGAHSLKFGVDLERIQINQFIARAIRGAWRFGGLLDLLAANASRFEILVVDSESSAHRGWRRIRFGWFVQDDFRLRPNLTLNLGLRHEFFTAPSEVNGKSSALINTTDPKMTPGPPFVPSKTGFAPRVGLAWDPTGNGKTSVRLGAGVYHNHVVGRTWIQEGFNNSDFVKALDLRTNIPFPNAFTTIDFSRLTGDLTTGSFQPFHLRIPTSIHYNLEVQRQLAPTLSLRVGYVGQNTYNNARRSDANQRIPQILPDGSKFIASNAPFINPNFSRIRAIVTDTVNNYHGLQVVLQKTVSAGLLFNVSYSLSKAHSEADQITFGQTQSTSSGLMEEGNLARDYSLSAYDQRHTLVVNGIYQMPWDNLLHGKLAKAILGGWAVNGIYSYGSGLAGDILTGFNNSRSGDSDNPDRPNLNPGFSNNPINGVTAGCQGIPAGQKLKTPDRWYDPCAFELNPAGTFGNLGRNTLTVPGLFSVDFTLVKTMPLTEQSKLEFRAEFFNLFNHANFGLPVLSTFNTTRTRNGSTGRITTTGTDNRQIQLGLKLIF